MGALDLNDHTVIRDVSFRINEYNTLNDLDHKSWIPLKLAIVSECYSMHPEPFPQKMIQELYVFHESSISRSIKRLQDDGFVTLERITTTDCCKGIRLTAAGKAFADYVLGDKDD